MRTSIFAAAVATLALAMPAGATSPIPTPERPTITYQGRTVRIQPGYRYWTEDHNDWVELMAEPIPEVDVRIYEDGSGVQYIGDTEMRTFPQDTFVWDCGHMGNRVCGAPAPGCDPPPQVSIPPVPYISDGAPGCIEPLSERALPRTE